MIPAGDLIECANCDCWFAGASLDEVFYHGTCACRRELENTQRSDSGECVVR